MGPNPQSPIPNPQSPIPNEIEYYSNLINYKNYLNLRIFNNLLYWYIFK